VRIDRSDDGDERQDAADVPRMHRADAGRDAGKNRDLAGKDAGHGETGSALRVERTLEHRATVEAVNRTYAIDQGYARVQEIEEKTVTPAMRRIEAEDPDRRLVGLENRLKGKDRLSEKVTGMPKRSGSNSITTRCAMCAEGRNATVESCGPRGRAVGPMSILATTAACVTSAIFGSPVTPEVR